MYFPRFPFPECAPCYVVNMGSICTLIPRPRECAAVEDLDPAIRGAPIGQPRGLHCRFRRTHRPIEQKGRRKMTQHPVQFHAHNSYMLIQGSRTWKRDSKPHPVAVCRFLVPALLPAAAVGLCVSTGASAALQRVVHNNQLALCRVRPAIRVRTGSDTGVFLAQHHACLPPR